jgi:hypothetical protein
MKKRLAVLVLAIVTACASKPQKLAPTQPEVTIEQLSSESGIAEHITGPVSVHFRVTVTNPAPFPITLKQTLVQSVGAGAYSVNPATNSSNLVVGPGATESIEFWVAGFATTTIAGVNGPVTMRVTTEFQGPSGAFQNIVVRQVMARF